MASMDRAFFGVPGRGMMAFRVDPKRSRILRFK